MRNARDRVRFFPFAAALVCVCALGQNTAGALLEGVVLENRSGRPLARSKVKLESLRGVAVTALKTVLTDSRGQFRFSSLASGAYLLTASRAGYATTRYGQKRRGAGGTPIALDADHEFFAEIRLSHLGVITGQVLDENEVGLTGQQVYAFRVGPQTVRMAAAAVSDDRGVYRLTGLEPGRYAVRTGPRELEDGRGLLPTYFGQTTEARRARTVEIALDDEVSGTDVQPLPGRLVSLSGDIGGAAQATVYLYTDTGRREAHTGPDGRFSFDQLAPGDYVLLAEAAHPGLAAFSRVAVGDRDAGVHLALSPMPVIRVRCEDGAGRLADPRVVSVFVRREEPRDPDAAVHRILGGESIAAPPGDYAAGALAPGGYYVAAIRGDRGGAGTNEFAALPGRTLELVVSLVNRPAVVAGRVLAADGQPVAGAPVYLHAIDPELCSRLNGFRSTRANERGEYRFDGLPPGKYQILSSFDLSNPNEEDWGRLSAEVLSLEEMQTAQLDVRLQGDL